MAQPDNKLVLNLLGGMNVKAGPLIIKDDECELAVNYILDKIGTLQRRGGYAQFGGNLVANKPILGLFNFANSNSSNNVPLAVVNNSGSTASVIYYLNAGSWTISDLVTSLANARTYFSTFVDYVFRVNGNDAVKSSTNGLNWGTTNCPITITPRYTKVFQDRVYMAHGGSANKSRVWFSSLPSGGGITWDTGADYFDVNPDDGDEITGFENNGNRLLIFKHRALYRWNFGQVEPDRVIGVGTDAQDSIATNYDLGITFFANQHGVYSYTANRPKLLSRKIQPFVSAVSDWTAVRGGVDAEHYYLYVGNITVGTRSYRNVMLVYHIALDAWTIFEIASQVTMFAPLLGVGTDEQLCFGAADGKTYLTSFALSAVDGDAPYTSDSTLAPIDTDFISKEYLLSFPTRTNLAWIDVFSTVRGNATTFYDLDRRNNFQQLRPLEFRITNIRIPDRECNSVRLRITDVGTSLDQESSIIEGFNFEHVRKDKRDEQPSYPITPPGYGKV